MVDLAGGGWTARQAGTTGEGVLLHVDERHRLAERFLAVGRRGSPSRCTRGPEHPGHRGAGATPAMPAPMPSPSRPRTSRSTPTAVHYLPAARAADPLPFMSTIRGPQRVRDPVAATRPARHAREPRRLKVCCRSGGAPYLLDGLDVFVGSEPLALEGPPRSRRRGVGAGHRLAGGRRIGPPSSADAGARGGAARRWRPPLHAALKVLVDRGVLGSWTVPLRDLTDDERGRSRPLVPGP
jgi:hypothetical protein